MRDRLALIAVGSFVMSIVVVAPAVAQDDDLPSVEFLEYLGSWEESDEEWLVVAEQFMGQPAAGDDETTEFEGDDDDDSAAPDDQTSVDETREGETDDNDED